MSRREPDPSPSTQRLAALIAGRRGRDSGPDAGPDAGEFGPVEVVPAEVGPGEVRHGGETDEGFGEAFLEDEFVGSRSAAQRPPARVAPAAVVLPESLRGARVGVSSRALLGVVAVLLVVAGVVGARVWWADSRSEPVPVESVAGASPGARGSAGPPGTAPAPANAANAATPSNPASQGEGGGAGERAEPTTAPGSATASGSPAPQVFVHVVGEVARPGVVRLTASARVADAVRRCGGLTGKADATSVNLARPVVDGEQVVVRPKGKTPAALAAPAPAGASPAAPAAPGSAGSKGSKGSAPSAPVDLNTADQAALEQLPGVGPVMAQRIVQWRSANGRFGSVDELAEVDGIGPKTLERLRPHVRV